MQNLILYFTFGIHICNRASFLVNFSFSPFITVYLFFISLTPLPHSICSCYSVPVIKQFNCSFSLVNQLPFNKPMTVFIYLCID